MKTVFSKTRDVCRLWAAQTQGEARTGSNASFRGDALYSYGTMIARIVPAPGGNPPIPDGARVVLISSGRWSVNTSKVQGEARDEAAKRCDRAVFTVPALTGSDMHERNLDYFAFNIVVVLWKLQRGRPGSIASYRSVARAIIATAENYARTFAISWTYAGPDPDEVLHVSERAA